MQKKYLALLVALLIVLASCGQVTPTSSPAPPPGVSAQTPPAEQGWEQQWEKTVAAAKGEGKVVLYTTAGAEVRLALSRAFQDRFGVELEFVSGKGEELSEKLFTERRAGLYLADAYMAGITTQTNTLKPAGLLEKFEPSLILPEVLDPAAWIGRELPFIDKEHRIIGFRASPHKFFNTNKQLVKEGEIKGAFDLLAPKWRRIHRTGD